MTNGEWILSYIVPFFVCILIFTIEVNRLGEFKSRRISYAFYLFFVLLLVWGIHISKAVDNQLWKFLLAAFPVYIIRKFTKKWPSFLLPVPAILFVAVTFYLEFRNVDYHTVSYTTKGKIDVTVLYDQYFETPYSTDADTLLYVWGYRFCKSDTAERYFFTFRCRDHDETHMNVLHLDSGSVKKECDIFMERKDYCVETPIAKSTIRSYQEIKSVNWSIITREVYPGCQDTHISDLEIKSKKGKVKFRNLNNVRVYELDRYGRRNSLIVVSARLCASEIMIFKIESRDWKFDL